MPLILKNRPRFMTGYNAGSRHAKFGTIPANYTHNDKSDDYKAGYQFGIRDRKAGILTDEDAATNAIYKAWDDYAKGGPIPTAAL